MRQSHTETSVRPDGGDYPTEMETLVRGDGAFVVARGDGERWSLAPFYPVFREESGARYGWRCANCGSLDVAMDPMGHIRCTACGNQRKATRWDAAYL